MITLYLLAALSAFAAIPIIVDMLFDRFSKFNVVTNLALVILVLTMLVSMAIV